ncbi:MAG: flagellar biosynthetic protein FliO [bacterium]
MKTLPLAATPTFTLASPSDINIFWIIIKIALYLGFVALLAFLIVFVFKRKRRPSEEGIIQVIAIKTIAPGRYIQIIEILNRILILGIGENINLLSEIKDKEEIDLIKAELSKERGRKNPDIPFANYLFKKKIDFLETESERLKNIEK